MKRVSFKTVGCRLNQAETAQMAAGMEAAGFSVVPFGEACDVGVVHTCSITENAVRKCLRLARTLRRQPSHPVVVLAGCAVEAGAEDLLERSGADLVVGQPDKMRLPELLAEFDDDFRGPPLSEASVATPRFDTTRALVKVQDGCDFRCAYCIVPYARHAPVSRPFGDVLDEAKRLSDNGYREVVVTGANLGCYRDGTRELVDLLAALESLPGIARIRLSSIELSTTERRIIDFMATSDKLCNYLHLPLQSGDDTVLRTMGRRYSVGEYEAAVGYAVERIPYLGLGTDIIVGFPGEDDLAFENTERLVAALPFSNLHVFPYSRRPGTRAAEMPDRVPVAEKKRRSSVLTTLGNRKRRRFAEGLLGKTVSLLVERLSDGGSGTGWTGEYIEARVSRPGLAVNDIVTFGPSRCVDGVLE
jgi:threonylcarbamoyladenosine tRNA methylthiotransferase MtaB